MRAGGSVRGGRLRRGQADPGRRARSGADARGGRGSDQAEGLRLRASGRGSGRGVGRRGRVNQSQLSPDLKRLRLSGILDSLEVRSQQAIAEQWSYAEFLTRLVQDEVERRAHKQLALRLRRGNVATTKTLETFDFAFNPSINRQQVFDLA